MTARDRADPGRYLRTVRNLRPEQVGHRVRLRVRQSALRRWPGPFERRWRHSGGEPSWPDGFQALDERVPPHAASIEDLEQGRVTFLNEPRDLGCPVAWDPADASQLWLYHQHYWEWVWTLLDEPDRRRAQALFERQVRGWIDAVPFGRWNAWAPYPASVRAWVFVNVESRLVRGTAVEGPFHELLRLHAGFVEHNLELDVGGNHLLKNLKALVGLGVFFADGRLVDKAVTHLNRELSIQVLADGGHFELSPSYHCQVLGDLLDISSLMEAAGYASVPGLADAIGLMQRWLGAMVMPDGDVPLFNDGERVGRARIRSLAPEPPSDGPLTVLAESGYVVARPGTRIHLVADVGAPGPPDLPAHAHADCLTFELAVDGRRVVVDPGTSLYAAGPQRQWERSTPAHNTVTVDGVDQTEVWGSFRAGRLARATLDGARVEGKVVEIRAHHTGYGHLAGSPVHRRHWRIEPERIEITDCVDGAETHGVGCRLLLDVDQVVDVSDDEVECTNCRIAVRGPDLVGEQSGLQMVPTTYAVAHGELLEALAIDGRWRLGLPAELTTTIDLTSDA